MQIISRKSAVCVLKTDKSKNFFTVLIYSFLYQNSRRENRSEDDMKKIFSVSLYFIMSVLLFLGGVLLEADPSGGMISTVSGNLDDRDKEEMDGSGAAENSDDNNLSDRSDTEADGDETSRKMPMYYYSLLDDEQKDYYDQISEAAVSMESSVVLAEITHDEMDLIFQAVQYDHPEYFWIESSYSYRNVGDSNDMELIFNYNCTGEEKKERENTIEQAAADILAEAPSVESDYEKIKYVFETLVDRTQYDLGASDNQNIYSVFGNWTSVCAGYAKATKYLLDQMGVDSIYVTGNAEGESHAWNIVSCEGRYYCVDTTWGDPTYQEGIGVDVDTTSYEYLCCPDSMLSRTHTADSTSVLPECTDNSLEYYRLQGRYLEEYDQEEIINIMKKDIDSDAERTDIQFSTPEVYSQVITQLESLIQEGLRYEQSVKGSTGGVYYQYNENTCKISVFWER